MSGNVFAFSFSNEGFEAVINLTEIDQEYVLAKMSDDPLPQSVASILSMLELRATFNAQRNMEVWLAKLDDSFTEEGLIAWADEDPQAVADLARMGEKLSGRGYQARRKPVII